MVELALGVAIFLLAALGAIQVGLLALAEEGVQSATLAAARTASGTPPAADPILALEGGAQSALATLAGTEVGMAKAELCSTSKAHRCWAGAECVRYRGSVPLPGTQLPCALVPTNQGQGSSYGPVPTELDGKQDPRCHGGDCFGASLSMAGCAGATVPGLLKICVAYTSWPPRAVDVWIAGGLRPIVPWIGGAGLDNIPVAGRLRIQVEAFSA